LFLFLSSVLRCFHFLFINAEDADMWVVLLLRTSETDCKLLVVKCFFNSESHVRSSLVT
jgi:hypothetical protein